MTAKSVLVIEKSDKSIGTASIDDAGTVTLHLRVVENGLRTESVLTYARDHADYQMVLQHLGGLKPGESKTVPPWPKSEPKADVLCKPLNQTASEKFPGALSKLSTGEQVKIRQARALPGSASLLLVDRESGREVEYFVRWVADYHEARIALIEQVDRTTEPDQFPNPQAIVRVLAHDTLAVVGETEFASMLKVMNADIQIASGLEPSQWNSKFKSKLQATFAL